jgi:hypothetical protein
MKKTMWAIFWVLVGYFILLAANLFVCGIRFLLSLEVSVVSGLFFALGIALIVLTLKSKPAGWLRNFLIMTGAAPIGIPIDIPLAFPFLAGRILAVFPFPQSILEMTSYFILYLILLTYMTGIIGTIALERRTMDRIRDRYGKLITTSFFLTGIGIIVFLLSLTFSVYFHIDMNIIGFSMVMVGLVILIVGLIRRKKLGGVKRILLIALASIFSLPVLYLTVSYVYYMVTGEELI